jgi:hypothetical protein
VQISRRTAAVLVATVAVAVAAWLVSPRHEPTDEEQIAAAVQAMATGAEERNPAVILEHVSEGYRGEAGSKDDLRGLLFGYLRNAEFVSVLIRGLRINVEGDGADVSLRAILTRVRATSEVKASDVASAGALEFKTRFVREGGKWRVNQASRREIAVTDAILP